MTMHNLFGRADDPVTEAARMPTPQELEAAGQKRLLP